jgi:hypothetical protein
VYNCLERRIGWILLSIGAIIIPFFRGYINGGGYHSRSLISSSMIILSTSEILAYGTAVIVE